MKLSISFLACITAFSLIGCGGGGSSTKTINRGFITAKFTMTSLPSSLPVNMANTPENYSEYYWTVWFDIDGNGYLNDGDVEISLNHIKRSGDQAADMSPSSFDMIVSDQTGPNSANSYQLGTVQVDGNIITLQVPKYGRASLENIDDTIQINFKTFSYDSMGNVFYDLYPASGTTSIPADGVFIDETGEIDLGGLTHIDMERLEIQID
jgi:hypothetical protein